MLAVLGNQPISITKSAASKISRLMQNGEKHALRIGVRKGGCAGMEYTMEYVDHPQEHDEVVEQGGARILIAPMAQMFLFGTEIDYEESLLESGFKFRNPNVSESCGCGESVKFDLSLKGHQDSV